MDPLWHVSTRVVSGTQFRVRVKMPGRSDNKDKEKRKEVQNELCAKNEYFIYQCTDKEVQKGRVAASRAKSARTRPSPPAKAEVKASAPVSSIKADLAEFRKIKARAPASSARKMSDPEKEAVAQQASDKISKSLTRISTRRTKPVSARIEDALSASSLRGSTRSRARSLAASKSARTISRILQ